MFTPPNSCRRRRRVGEFAQHGPGGPDPDLSRPGRPVDRPYPAGHAAGPRRACAQWSSYDRASRYDEKTGKYIAWDANGDGGGMIRSEGDQVVMAEMKGPGCIWRIWSAAPGEGHVKIYLDDQPKPAVDLPFAHYFDGKHVPLRLPGPVLRPGQRPFQRAEPLSADPLSEVVQGRRRQGLGQLLPLQLRNLSGRDHGPDLQRRLPPNTPID